jgi:transposase
LALRRRRCTREFKLQVVREVEAGKSPAQAAREHQVHPPLIIRWRKEHLHYAERAFTGNGRLDKDEARTAELARMIGQLTREHALLKKALLRLEARCRAQAGPGGN